MSPRNWKLRIEDILAAIETIKTYTNDLTSDSFAGDRRTIDAVMHNIMIIGESARNMPDQIVSRYPEIPWDKMRAIRNLVVHLYFGIRTDILWQTVKDDLPPLTPILKKVLENES